MTKQKSSVAELIDAAVNNPDRAKELVSNDPTLISQRYIHGETSVHFLAVEGYAQGVRVLCDLGADVNAKNDFDAPPLLDVVRLKKHDIARILIDAGADTSYKSETYGSLLEIAAESSDKDMIKLLKDSGAR